MIFSVLGSGSRGNCVYIECGKTAILIDGGFSGKEIARRLQSIGKDISRLDAICVTHEHADHIAGVGVLSRRSGLTVFANPATFSGGEKQLGKLAKRQEFDTGDQFAVKDLLIRSFRISHDTADPVGYVISSDRVSLGYCTDTGKVTHLMQQRLAGCTGLILEFNHNLQMLKNGPYPPALQQRVRSNQGHLTNEDAAGFLKGILHQGLRMTLLAHLSETNNTPHLALEAASAVMGAETETQLILTCQDRPTQIFTLV
jgi:phosphoribosyl 1,2-cyclic phosphodiesterase